VHVLILSLDTSSPTGSIAVLRDDHLLGVVSTSTEEAFSSRIFRQLEFLLAELSLGLDSFDLFAVNSGPGSFTGVRMGLTAATAWSEVFARQVVPVSGLEAVAAQAAASDVAIVPVTDARRSQLYVGHYRSSQDATLWQSELVRVTDDAVMTPEEFLAWLRASPERAAATVATPSSSWLLSLLASGDRSTRAIRIQEVSAALAPAIGKIAFRCAQRHEGIDALRLDANYVRRSDAELNWKGN
jgi:tRNA threonylcarbamoyladenosine biosynthesis protein TsaB